MKRREEKWVLVPCTFRERKTVWNEPRTYEQIQEAERAAEERKQAAEALRAAEAAKAAEEDAAFQLKKKQAEAESALIRPRKGLNQ
jgi:hypothetical protein